MRSPLRFAALVGALVLVPAATAAASPLSIANDTYTNTTSQHQTIVEPDTFAFGSKIVAAAQSGRFNDGGSSGIVFSTSSDNGANWTSGHLPGITTFDGGAYARATDPSVAYDARHGKWLVSTLALVDTPSGPSGRAVLTSSSSDGLTWSNPVTTALASRRQDFDKNWIVCDNTSTSIWYGSCYTQFDDFGSGNALKMSYSRDGGQNWTASRVPRAGVIGGQPLVRSNGDVVVPLDNASSTAVGYTISTNGGVKFGTALTISSITAATDPGNIRSGALPTAEIAGDNNIFLAWEDCRFRASCSSNDIVYTTSTDGKAWSAVQRVPIDGVTSTVDHLLPGIAVDRSTSGSATRVGLVYYYFPVTNCGSSCQLFVGYISSANGGASWSAPTQLAGPMTMSWLPDTTQGRMVGDYMSASFGSDTNVHPAFTVAAAPSPGSDCSTSGTTCSQPLYSDTLAAAGGPNTAADPVLFSGSVSPGVSAFKKDR